MRISDWSSDVCSSDLPEQVVGIAAAGPRAAADQEPGQRQQPVTVRLSRRERDGAAGARADIGEVVVPAGDGAAVAVETVTEVGQNPAPPTPIAGDPPVTAPGEPHPVEQGRQPVLSPRIPHATQAHGPTPPNAPPPP